MRDESPPDTENLSAEPAKKLSDVVHYAVAIAAVNDIDPEKAMPEKDEHAAVKYGHDINLKDFIIRSRT